MADHLADATIHKPSDTRLYSFSPETTEKLRKFRLGTSRAKDPQAMIYMIDAKSQEIRPVDGEVYSKMEDLADDFPDSSPRFILLSYPLTIAGRPAVPYVLLYYLPENCNPSQRMSYAGAVELMRSAAEVNRVIEVENETDVIEIEKKLQSQ
ncbi:Glial factor naturation factor [Trichophyton interdigitale]|uniref:Glial factor naturation factor n=1 Tax=Trichophyton interdigitale TaxID=101480 RepID=A0A9P4YGC9_9EURO|nr:Glial factor naturation factor [Trichophyton interdigitale]KAF3895725.1 Glial factor naturation factor [Trichophyton interdigitale]KAG8208442.1 Glial factor naturation factor [Trichophyton interdigitale]